MAFSSRPITTNEASAAFRTVTFGVYNLDGSPKTDLAPAKARLFENGAYLGLTTNDFAHVEDDMYSVVLTQAEVNKTAQTKLEVGADFGGAYNVVRGEAVIVSPKVAATIASGDIATDALSAAAASAAFVSKVQSGLATAAALANVDGRLDTEIPAILAAVDTEVAAIKAKTDNLPSSPAAVGSEMVLATGAITTLVNAIVRAVNGADGYSIAKDVPNNRIVLNIPGVGTVYIPADFNTESIGVDGVG